MSPRKLKTLSRKIAADLLTDDGKKARRLALVHDESKPANQMSGWCEAAVADRVLLHLQRALA